MFSNLSRAEIYNRKVKGKSIYKIELKSTTFVKLTCVIINRNNFRARIFNQIQIPARETSRSRGFAAHRSLFEIDLWASLACSINRSISIEFLNKLCSGVKFTFCAHMKQILLSNVLFHCCNILLIQISNISYSPRIVCTKISL